jgi:ABC-type glycerol-3-phosphate transport system substrate-binding protein
MRKLALLGLFSVFVLVSAGLSAQAVTLNVLLEGGGVLEQKAIAQKFEAATGVKVNLIEVPYQSVYDKLSAEIASGGSSYDVATIDVVWIPAFQSGVAPLDDLFTPAVQANIFPSLLPAAQSGGHWIGMPTWANSEILFYRTDLFGDAKNKAAFKKAYGYELAAPKTWKQYVDTAKFFTKNGMYGTDVVGVNPEEYEAFVLQAGSPGVIFDAQGNVIIDNKAHADALAYYVDLFRKHKVTPPSVLDIDWGAAQKLFYDGKTAMMLFWGHAYHQIPKDSPYAKKIGVAPMIAGPAGIAGIPGPWYNVLLKNSKHQAEAKAFIKFAYENNAMGFDSDLGLAATKSAFAEYQNKPGYEYVSALMTTLNAPQTIGRPMVGNLQQITTEVVVPMLQDALSGKKTPAEATKWAAAQIKAMQQ